MQFLSLGYCWNLLPTHIGVVEKMIRFVVNTTKLQRNESVPNGSEEDAQSSPNVSNDVNEISNSQTITVTRPVNQEKRMSQDKRYFAPNQSFNFLLVCLCTNIQAISFDSAEFLSEAWYKCEGTGVDISEGFWLQVWRRPSSEERRQLQPVFGQLCNSRKRVIWTGFPMIFATRNVRVSEEMQIYSVTVAYFTAWKAYIFHFLCSTPIIVLLSQRHSAFGIFLKGSCPFIVRFLLCEVQLLCVLLSFIFIFGAVFTLFM